MSKNNHGGNQWYDDIDNSKGSDLGWLFYLIAFGPLLALGVLIVLNV